MKDPMVTFLASTSLPALIVLLAVWAALREALWVHWHYPVIFVFAANALWNLFMLRTKDARWQWPGLLVGPAGCVRHSVCAALSGVAR
jgi:hypothetical protein